MTPKTPTPRQARAGLARIDAELRTQLTPIEIGLRLRDAKVYYEALHPETRASRTTGGGKKRSTRFKGFVRERARRIKKSPSWVEQHIGIVTGIPDDLHAPLNKSSIKDYWTTLYDLSRVRPMDRLRRVAELVIKNPKRRYKDALNQAEREVPDDGVPEVEPVVSKRVTILPKSWEHVTAAEIAPGSVDAIISDIDWGERTMNQLGVFVAFCHRVLKPRGRVVIQTGQATAAKVETAFRKRFRYQWTLAYETHRESRPPWLRGGRSRWMPVLVLGKTTGRWPYNLPDMLREEDDPRDVGDTDHPFVKGIDAFSWLVTELTPEHGLVVDPFMGTGTTGVASVITGRQFVGLETNPGWFAEAKEKLGYAVESRVDREAEEERPRRRARARRRRT